MAGVYREEDHTPEERAVLQEVRKKFERAQRFRKRYDDRWNRLYWLRHNWERMRRNVTHERDRDMGGVLLREAKREWGDPLEIPIAFATIETAVPQALSNNPHMLPIPGRDGDDVQEAVKAVQRLFDRDQARINYEIKLQSSFKRAETYGLGVQKTYWRTEKKKVRVNERRLLMPGYKGTEKEVLKFDGPMVEDIDIFDFFWDPNAKDIDTCQHVIHRTWRDFDYIVSKVKSGEWRQDLDLEEIKNQQAPNAKGDVWKDRMTGGRYGDAPDFGQLHEVWEYHTCEKVCTVLNGQVLVQEDGNPAYHNELPFQIFRPHLREGEFVGTGMLEPSEPLINELGDIRGNRLDAARVALNPPIFYQEDMLDIDDLAFGPNVAVGTMTAPRDAVFMPSLPDVPNSSYQETKEVKGDIDSTTGISDPVMGGESDSGSTSTATGMQLTVAAATRRIQLHTKNCEVEMIRPAARQWLSYYKQKILEGFEFPVPDQSQDTGYGFQEITPEHLAAIEDVEPEGGSTQADNEQQKQNAAVALYNVASQMQNIDHEKLDRHTIKAFNVPDSESWIVPMGPADYLQKAAEHFIEEQGTDPQLAVAAVHQFLATVTQGNGATSSQQSQNGGTAQPVAAQQEGR